MIETRRYKVFLKKYKQKNNFVNNFFTKTNMLKTQSYALGYLYSTLLGLRL